MLYHSDMDSISTLGWIGIIVGAIVVLFGIFRFKDVIFKSLFPSLLKMLGTLLVMALLYGLITLLS